MLSIVYNCHDVLMKLPDYSTFGHQIYICLNRLKLRNIRGSGIMMSSRLMDL